MRNTSYVNKIAFAANRTVNEENYWVNKLSGELVESSFPYDRKKSDAKEYLLEQVEFGFNGNLFSRLMKLSNNSHTRLHMIFIAAVNILLSKYTGNRDVILGTSIYKQEIEAEFINTVLILRNTLEGAVTFKELLLQVRDTIIEANENQNYPIEVLFQKLNIPFFKDNDFPIIRTAIILENIQDKNYISYIKPDMLFSFFKTGENVEGILEYNATLYKKKTIERIVTHFIRLFRETLFNLDIEISHIDILSDKERKQVLYDFNNTIAGYPAEKTIHGLFEEQVERTPYNTAVIFEDKQLTYKELNGKANQLARLLRGEGVIPDIIVGLMVNRSIEMILGILAVLKSGGAYLPIDPACPGERIKCMLSDCSADVLLTQNDLTNRIEFAGVEIDITGKEIYKGIDNNLSNVNIFSDIVYVIYTSGSTGSPKGVILEHKSIVNILGNIEELYPLGERDSYLLKTNYTFDVSVTEIFGWFFGKGRLIILGVNKEKDPGVIIDVIDKHGVTHINFVPTMLDVFLGSVDERDREKLYKLKYVFVCGEVFTGSLASKIENLGIPARFENIYGPTEAAIYTTKYSVDGNYNFGIIPIGKPLKNMSCFVFDRMGASLQPVSVPGELCIGGVGVARGYINKPELSAERFILSSLYRNFHFLAAGCRTRHHPEANENRHKRTAQHIGPPCHGVSSIDGVDIFYRTGDLVRWLPDGNIEFLGRIDQQVKVRGYRIELGEIESKLLSIEFIKEAVVSAKERDGDKYLCAYIVADMEPSVSELREHLSQQLPDYMVPSYFIPLDKIPVTSSGKVDIKSLPEIKDGVLKGNYTTEYVAPANAFERKLAELWNEVLAVEPIGVNDNFFILGGNSLNAIQLARRLNEAKIDITVDEIFFYPTINKISSYMRDKKTITNGRDFEAVRNYLAQNYGNNTHYENYQINNNSCRVLFMPDQKLSAAKVLEEIIKKFGDVYYPNYVTFLEPGEEIIAPGEVNDELFTDIMSLETGLTKKQQEELARELNKNDGLSLLLKENSPVEQYSVSPLQYFHLSNLKEAATNITFFAYDFSYPTRSAEIRQILIRLVNENPLLRSVIVNNEGNYFIKEFDSFSNIQVPFVDISHFSFIAKKEISEMIKRELYKPFDIIGHLLYRIILFKWDESTYKLFIIFNHLIFDGESHKILRKRIDTVINEGPTNSHNRELKKSYRDYIAFLKSISAEAAGLDRYLDLPAYIEYSEKINENFKPGNLKHDAFEVDISDLQGELKDLYNEIFLLCCARLLGTLFEMDKVPIMLISNGRNYKDGNFGNIIGDFHDYVPVLFSLPGSTPQLKLANYLGYRRYITDNNLNFMNFFVKKFISGTDYSKILYNPFGFNTQIGQYEFLKKSFNDEIAWELHAKRVAKTSFQVVMSKDLYSDMLWVSYHHNSNFENIKVKKLFIEHYRDLVDALNNKQSVGGSLRASGIPL